jgi:hypothetical protein
VETTLKLINNSDNYAVFKIKTTRPKAYCVRPNSGCISPHTAQEVKGIMWGGMWGFRTQQWQWVGEDCGRATTASSAAASVLLLADIQ